MSISERTRHNPEAVFDCVVVGGGPAGMMAAVAAARAGMRTALVEKNARPGRKLLLTGGGRCNITNLSDVETFVKAFGRHGSFLRHALTVFGPDKFTAFLRRHGILLEKEGSMVFVRGGAERVFDLLENLMVEYGVEVRCHQRVVSVRKAGGGWEAVTERGGFVARRRLILAPGGMTYPSTGSAGDGYSWAEALGHKVVAPVPAAGPLIVEPNAFVGLQGISVDAVRVTILQGEKRRGTFAGAMLATGRGISGSAILDASVEVARLGREGKAISIEIDFAPEASGAEIAARIWKLREESPGKQLENALPTAALPKRLYESLLAYVKADGTRRLAEAPKRDIDAAIDAVKRLRLGVVGTGGVAECMVTVGGVSTSEVDAKTMESRVARGIYFAGEFLDLAARCGGFNLQCAFSTGFLAGSPARGSEEVRK
jgi:hypothetical protein